MTDAANPPPITDPNLLRDLFAAALATPEYWDAAGFNTIIEFHKDEWRLILDLIGAGIAARLGPVQGTTAATSSGLYTTKPVTFAYPSPRDDFSADPFVRTDTYEMQPDGRVQLVPPEPAPVTPNGVLMEPGDRTTQDADSRFAQSGGVLVKDFLAEPVETLNRIELATQADQDWTHPTPITGITGTVANHGQQHGPISQVHPITHVVACPSAPLHGGCHFPDCAEDCTGRPSQIAELHRDAQNCGGGPAPAPALPHPLEAQASLSPVAPLDQPYRVFRAPLDPDFPGYLDPAERKPTRGGG